VKTAGNPDFLSRMIVSLYHRATVMIKFFYYGFGCSIYLHGSGGGFIGEAVGL
jgi:hypothetical protein